MKKRRQHPNKYFKEHFRKPGELLLKTTLIQMTRKPGSYKEITGGSRLLHNTVSQDNDDKIKDENWSISTINM